MGLLMVASMMALTAAAPAQAEVALTVRNRTGVHQPSAPVRGGVPFARGVLKECSTARLVDAAGKEIPCQVRPLARWYDGSIKWLLVDTQVSVPVEGEVRLRLQPGRAPKAGGRRVWVAQRAEGIFVNTGPARFLFPAKRFGLPGAAWADLDGDGKWDTKVVSGGSEFVCEVEHQAPGPPEEENWLRDAAGGPRERFTAAPTGDYRVTVESANPLHAVIKLSGWLVNDEGRRLLQYFIRAHAYAGSPELRLVHTFVYAGKPKDDFIRTLALRLPWSVSGPVRYALGGERRHEGTLAGGDAVSLSEIGPKKLYHLVPYTEDKTVTYTVAQGGREVARGKEAAGWARLAGQRATAHLALRNFWQMQPKEIRLDARGATLYLWPEAGGKVLDLRRRYDYVENTYHYDLSLWPYGGEGVGITHEMLLRYGPAREDVGETMVAALNAPLLLECTPEYYAASGAFGPFAVADPARYPHLEGLLNVDLEWIRHNQRAFHWDGMIDYGDTFFHGYETPSHYGYVGEKCWCSRGYVGWLCNDGTLTQALFLHYLRTGDYEAFRTAEAMCRHVTEVDTCHYCAEEPNQVGGGHRHDQQHWGNGVRGYGTATHGAIHYYLLTGDERTFDVMREYTQYHIDGAPSENEDRIGGLIRMWEITGDPKLKEKADALLAEELRVPEGQAWPFVTGPHFRFVSNTSVSLLYYLYSVPPADSAPLKKAIAQAADSLEAEVMTDWGEVSYYPILLTALAYRHTGDRRYAAMTASLLQRLPVPRELTVPREYPALLRALPFAEMVAVARQWNVNNVYASTIHHLVPLPYALAALRQADMDEAAIWATPRLNREPEPFTEVILPSAMSPEFGFLYQARLAHGAPSDQGGGRSTLILLEDDKPLGPAHSAHADIRREGKGRWSHWGARTIWFSTSDNSDPRTNGRQYKVVYPGPAK